jgi:hypothetical protein
MTKFVNDQLDALLAQLKDAYAKGDEAAARKIGQAFLDAIPSSPWGDAQEDRPIQEPEERGSHVISVREVDERCAVWEEIKRHLPPEMIDTEEKCNRVAWRIGFLLGVGGETIGAKLLRWLWRLP